MSNTQDAKKATMQDKVRKLLAQAEDRAGTPEGDVFQAKAFELMAQYDIDEASARAGQTIQEGAVAMEFKISGKYTETQMLLLNAIVMQSYSQLIKTGSDTCVAYGMPTHLENIRELFYRLSPSMVAQAGKARPSYPTSHSGELRVFRRSFMRGFAYEVGARLQKARVQAEEATRTAQGGSGSGALVLMDDAKRAQVAMREAHPRIRQGRSAARSDHGGTAQGRDAGSRANLGTNTRLAGSRTALGA